ncbi:hypothetical protein CYFUS_005364 [Cystobacter fuscus]|uniref:Uncharacterized protein n=1 Tax=Cystobacter fuscus TaxID=43 RepID=A0A250J9N8_9BACT|nr:hypothetical protein CYFUS_005364 [Cystobacter fuscus]
MSLTDTPRGRCHRSPFLSTCLLPPRCRYTSLAGAPLVLALAALLRLIIAPARAPSGPTVIARAPSAEAATALTCSNRSRLRVRLLDGHVAPALILGRSRRAGRITAVGHPATAPNLHFRTWHARRLVLLLEGFLWHRVCDDWRRELLSIHEDRSVAGPVACLRRRGRARPEQGIRPANDVLRDLAGARGTADPTRSLRSREKSRSGSASPRSTRRAG